MLASVYARKSTEQTGVADEQKSVARQIEHARQYAFRKGWTVSDEHVYVDDGISGAEFANRPGFLRLMNALKPRPPFQVLIMSEESRLGREAIETAYALKQLVTAGVRVFFYLEDRERTLDSPTDKIMLSLTAFADELEREKARQRTYDAMVRKARAGHVTGGRVFGYDNVPLDGGWKVRVIRENEAAVIREIFVRCAKGEGLRAIAHALNDIGAPCPRPQLHRPAGWCPSSVREVLHRPLYRGEIVWNRTRKRNTWGQKQQHARPDTDWLRVPAPALRIVTEEAWAAAQERLSTSRAAYLRSTKGQLWGKPANGIEAKNLLTGLTQCALCGGGVYVTGRSHGRRRAFFYACTSFHRKGQTVCPNNQQVLLDEADEAVLEALETELLHPVVVAEALRQATTALIDSPEATAAFRDALDRRAVEIATSIERWTAAIGAGGDLPSLIARLQACEQDRARVDRERRELDAVTQLTGRDLQRIERDLQHRVDEWRTAARRNVAQGRQVLRKLLNQTRVTMRPLEDGTCQLSGRGDYGKLFSGICCNSVGVPNGGPTRVDSRNPGRSPGGGCRASRVVRFRSEGVWIGCCNDLSHDER